MTPEAVTTVEAYFTAWRARDFDTLASLLADDVTFVGPLGRADDADSYRQGIEGLSRIVTDIVVQKRFIAGDDDVLTWFDLHTSVAPPCPTANWMHLEHGKIKRVRVTFDPRGLAP
jgi:hypothetical protein